MAKSLGEPGKKWQHNLHTERKYWNYKEIPGRKLLIPAGSGEGKPKTLFFCNSDFSSSAVLIIEKAIAESGQATAAIINTVLKNTKAIPLKR